MAERGRLSVVRSEPAGHETGDIASRPGSHAPLPDTPLPLRRRWTRASLARAGTTPSRELVAGLTTFSAVSYVIVVNPAIVTVAGPDVRSLIVITALVSMLGTLVMALMADLPVALAPGMGVNAVFAQTVVVRMGVPYATALVVVFLSSVLILILAMSRWRARIMHGFPEPVLIGLQAGLGLFIAYLGFANGGLIVTSPHGLQFGNIGDPVVALVTLGVLLTPVLMIARVPAALPLSIAVMAVAGLFVRHAGGAPMTVLPDHSLALPHVAAGLLFRLDFATYFQHLGQLVPVTFYFLIVGFFYTGSTLITVLRHSDLHGPNGAIIYERRAYAADALAGLFGAVLGSCSVGAYVESAAGVAAGGRTGLSALVVAALFGLSLVAWPLFAAIPPQATAPALVITGILMLDIVTTIDASEPEGLIPPLLMMLVSIVTSDLMMALCLGCFLYTLIVAVRRKWRALTPMTLGLDAILAVYLVLTATTN